MQPRTQNLEFTDFLPPPPEVINIDDKEVPPILLTSQLPHQPKIEPPAASLPPLEMQHPSQRPSRYPSRARRPPQHLAQDYLFTTVAAEHNQPPAHPYQTAVGTVMDLAIKNEYMMAQLSHYVMTHTANSLYCTQDIKPKKKQYSLKAGLKEFTNCGKEAITKELTQFHTLKCFKPCDPSTLSRDERRSALTSLMFLTEKMIRRNQSLSLRKWQYPTYTHCQRGSHGTNCYLRGYFYSGNNFCA